MSSRRLAIVARDEFSLTLRRPMTWTLLVILFLMSWGLAEGVVGIVLASGDATVGGKRAFLTSEFALTQVTAVFTTSIYTFFLAAAAGLSIIRDDESRVLELLGSTPLRPSEYGWGKFSGVIAAFVSVLALNTLFLVLFLAVVPNADMLETRGPFALGNYLRPALMFALPTLLFYGGVTFGIGAGTRKAVLAFLVPISLIILSGVFLWSWSPTWLSQSMNRVLMFLDPSGLRWLRETYLVIDRGAEYYNTQPVVLDALIIINRLFWSAVGIGSAALGVRAHARRSRAAHVVAPEQVAAALAAGARQGAPEPVLELAAPLSTLGMRTGRSGFLSSAIAAMRAEGRELGSRAGLYLFVPLIIAQLIGAAFATLGAFDTPLLLTPGQLATSMMQTSGLWIALLLIFYGVESMERERAARLDQIQDAYPLKTGALLAGKLGALSIIWFIIAVAAVLAAAVIVLVQGKVSFSLYPFLLIWGLLYLPTFLAFASFVFMAWSIAGNRYSTYAIALVGFGATIWAFYTNRLNWVTNWILLSGIKWSDMGTLEMDRRALIWNRVLWLSMAVLFWAIAVRWYPRRRRDPIHLLRFPTMRSLLLSLGGAAPVLVVPLFASSYLWRQMQEGPQGARVEKLGKDYWKKNISTWKDARFPWLSAVDVDVDIHPEARSFSTKGSYIIRNTRDTTYKTLAMTVGRWTDIHWTIDGDSAKPDTSSLLYIFKLKKSLGKGDSIRVAFSYKGDASAPSKRGTGGMEFVIPSGAVMTSFGPQWFPLVGYVESLGVDKDNRAEPRQYPDDWYTGVTPPAFGSALPMTVRTRITVPADFVANGVGERESDVVKDGRRTVTWQSDQPVMAFNVVAGRLTERRGTGTALYYFPAHKYNIDEMIGGLDAARRWYGEWFGTYPWRTLKITEFPALATYAQGFATNISFSEDIGFLTKSEPKTNLAFLVVAHESAHQWWGNMLTPASGPGTNLLSEGLAHFSTTLLIEKVKGARDALEFRKRIESRYGNDRRSDAERKLYRIDGSKEGDGTVTYDKGGWVFWMLSDLMGRERALTGMRDFIAFYRTNEDHAALEDYTAHMRRYAPDTVAYDQFVRQWFDSVVVGEYRVDSARTKRASPNGEWETTATIYNAGTATMPVDIAVTHGERFPDDGSHVQSPAYKQAKESVLLAAGARRTVTIRSPFEPDKVVIDPDVRVLQLRRKLAEYSLKER